MDMVSGGVVVGRRRREERGGDISTCLAYGMVSPEDVMSLLYPKPDFLCLTFLQAWQHGLLWGMCIELSCGDGGLRQAASSFLRHPLSFWFFSSWHGRHGGTGTGERGDR